MQLPEGFFRGGATRSGVGDLNYLRDVGATHARVYAAVSRGLCGVISWDTS